MNNTTPPTSIGQTLISVWPLLFGIGVLMMANGLQGSLLGVRAETEAFDPTVIGLIMAGFFAGMLIGSVWMPKVVGLVGHVRVFAAMSAVASCSILIHAFFVQEVAWWFMRFVTGFCYAGIFVVAESWLNERTSHQTRGQVLALYFVVTFAGMGAGQLLLNLASVREADLFMLVSVLISAAAVPLLLTSTPVPSIATGGRVSLRRLLQASPLGTIGVFVAGLVNGAVFGMGAVYAQSAGFSISDTARFMALLILGAALMQWPIGRLSDLFDRRKVILITTLLAGIACLFATSVNDVQSWVAALTIVITGGFSLSIHSLTLAYTNDYLEPEEMVNASSGLVLIIGIGSVFGPLFIGTALNVAGPESYFLWLATGHFALGAFAIWRMTRREALPAEDQAPYIPAPLQGTEISTALSEENASEGERG